MAASLRGGGRQKKGLCNGSRIGRIPLLVIMMASWCCLQYTLWYLLEQHHTRQSNNMAIGTSSWRIKGSLAEDKRKAKITSLQDKVTATGDKKISHASDSERNSSIIGVRKPRVFENDHPEESPPVHIVFSTDCSGYQHWQGILLYYSARRIHQPGVITRIASGCTPEQQISIRDEWGRIDPTGSKFRVHFAPATTLHAGDSNSNNSDTRTKKKSQNNYKYSNKPGGILHWLQHHQPSLDDNTVVCLLDPDMILLKPITADLVTQTITHDHTTREEHETIQIRAYGKDQVEYYDDNESGTAQLLRVKSLLDDGYW